MNIELKKPVNDEALKDKVLGSLIGFAIGDAMGATTEFMDKEAIKAQYGELKDIIGGGWLNLMPGEVTDDTQMTMCIIDTFLENGKQAMNLHRFKNTVASKFVEWYKSNPPDVGNACRAGIERYMNLGLYMKTNNLTLGNGGLMRALPCYLMDNLMFNYAQNDITHNNAVCREFIKSYHEAMDMAMNGGRFYNNAKAMEPLGKVHNTFYNARLYGLGCETFEESIVRAVNDGGDADTIAAIAGSIAGMRCGFGAIPYRWVDRLDESLIRKMEIFTDMVVEHREMLSK